MQQMWKAQERSYLYMDPYVTISRLYSSPPTLDPFPSFARCSTAAPKIDRTCQAELDPLGTIRQLKIDLLQAMSACSMDIGATAVEVSESVDADSDSDPEGGGVHSKTSDPECSSLRNRKYSRTIVYIGKGGENDHDTDEPMQLQRKRSRTSMPTKPSRSSPDALFTPDSVSHAVVSPKHGSQSQAAKCFPP